MKLALAIKITDIQKAYVAGFFDGEGCVTFHIVGKNKNTVCYAPVCCIANNDINVLIYMQSIFGGKIYKKNRYSNKHGEGWTLNFTNQKDILVFLSSIKKFLIVKKSQADILCLYLKRRIGKISKRGQTPVIDKAEMQMISNVKDLNFRNNKRVRRISCLN